MDQLCLSELEVFDYLSTKYTSKAHAYGVSIFALLLVDLKLSKFQVQDLSKNAFSYSMVSIYTNFFNSLALVLLVLFAKILKYFGSHNNTNQKYKSNIMVSNRHIAMRKNLMVICVTAVRYIRP